jgi:hypothetical protein
MSLDGGPKALRLLKASEQPPHGFRISKHVEPSRDRNRHGDRLAPEARLRDTMTKQMSSPAVDPPQDEAFEIVGKAEALRNAFDA